MSVSFSTVSFLKVILRLLLKTYSLDRLMPFFLIPELRERWMLVSRALNNSISLSTYDIHETKKHSVVNMQLHDIQINNDAQEFLLSEPALLTDKS